MKFSLEFDAKTIFKKQPHFIKQTREHKKTSESAMLLSKWQSVTQNDKMQKSLFHKIIKTVKALAANSSCGCNKNSDLTSNRFTWAYVQKDSHASKKFKQNIQEKYWKIYSNIQRKIFKKKKQQMMLLVLQNFSVSSTTFQMSNLSKVENTLINTVACAQQENFNVDWRKFRLRLLRIKDDNSLCKSQN